MLDQLDRVAHQGRLEKKEILVFQDQQDQEVHQAQLARVVTQVVKDLRDQLDDVGLLD